MQFKDKLNDTLNRLNISQAKLSKLTGIGRSSISQYCSGKNIPTDERQVAIAEALGFAPDYFLQDEAKVEIVTSKRSGQIPRLPLKEAARLMGVHDTTLARGLQDGVFPWGYAIRGRGDKFVYWINAKRFAEIEGITL